MSDFPAIPPGRAPWLITLADLALLLLGFTLLLQATAAPEREALTRSLREAFGAEPPAPLPVAAFAVRFEPGASTVADTRALLTWARETARDPRVALAVTGTTDGTPADAGPDGPTLLAADRARAVAAALAGVVPPDRLRLATNPHPRGRAATVTLAFAGERS